MKISRKVGNVVFDILLLCLGPIIAWIAVQLLPNITAFAHNVDYLLMPHRFLMIGIMMTITAITSIDLLSAKKTSDRFDPSGRKAIITCKMLVCLLFPMGVLAEYSFVAVSMWMMIETSVDLSLYTETHCQCVLSHSAHMMLKKIYKVIRNRRNQLLTFNLEGENIIAQGPCDDSQQNRLGI